MLPNGEKDLRNAIWEAISTGELIIVDSDDAPREAHSDSDINLSSDIQRLSRKTAEQPSEPTDPSDDDASDGRGTQPGQPTTGEKKVIVTTVRTISLDNKDPTRVVLDALRNSVDDGAVTWMHLTLQATMSSGAADDVGSKAEASGMETTVTDL